MSPSVVPSRPRPIVPRTPALRAGPFEVRASWGWEEHDGCRVGTVATVGLRLGQVTRVRGRVLGVCLVPLPPSAAVDGPGLYVSRGLRLRSGGGGVARRVGTRRVAKDRRELDRHVVHAAEALGDDAVLDVLTPPTLDALRRDDIGVEWEGRDLVLYVEGLTGRDTRGRMAAVGGRIAAVLPRVAATLRAHPSTPTRVVAQP